MKPKPSLIVLANSLYPKIDHNSKLLMRVLPFLNCNMEIYSQNMSESNDCLPTFVENIPVHFIQKHKLLDRIIFHSLSLFISPIRADDLLCFLKMRVRVFFDRFKRPPDAVLSVFQLHASPLVASHLHSKTKKFLFLMDPTEAMYTRNKSVSDEPRWFINMIAQYDIIFTTRFIKSAMEQRGYSAYVRNIVEISFPVITSLVSPPAKAEVTPSHTITLLFAGRLYSTLRSPEYFLKIISQLDHRFRVIFIGDGCEEIVSKYKITTNAELITRPHIESEQLQKIVGAADILINIGNSVGVHLPSKTLEYINTGKPIVNFHKLDDCPTLYYLRRYPLCLNISEKNHDILASAKEFMDFCIANKGRSVDPNYIHKEYFDCTPMAVGQTINHFITSNTN